MKNSKLIKITTMILAFCLIFTCFAGCGDKTTINSSSQAEITSDLSSEASSLDAAESMVSSLEESSSKTETQSLQTSSEKVSSTKPVEKTVFDLVDFIVEVPAGREPVILQLTDTQIIDSAQARSEDRIGDAADALWAPENMDKVLFNCIKETVTATKPDLILITGDVVYGEFDDKGTSMQALVKHMESYKIPWAPIYGNHDGETKMGIDWYSEQFENAKYCLFKRNQTHSGRKISGDGNYTVGIKQGGKLTRVFFMMDSNGCSNMSEKTFANGTSVSSDGIKNDQQNWCTAKMLEILNMSNKTKFSVAFHIPNTAAIEAYSKYEQGTDISKASNKGADDFGFVGSNLKSVWDIDNYFFETLKICGTDSLLMGHYHYTNAVVKSDGVYFVFGQKTGTYDSYVKKDADGTLTTSGSGTPQVGGTVIKLTTGGAISKIYNYICK